MKPDPPVLQHTVAPPGMVFAKYGLRVRSLLPSRSPHDPSAASAAARFRDALEELGGLYASFARFLAWRADLLRTGYLGRLRNVRLRVPPLDPSLAARILAGELADAGRALASTLEPAPCWSTVSRCAWKGEYKGRAVAVQIARDPLPDSAFESFEQAVSSLADPDLELAVARPTLRQFRQWVRLADSPGRERSYLEALDAARARTSTRYPILIPEISTERVLCFEWFAGETLASALGRSDERAVRLAAEALLEQLCLTATIDADLDPESIVVTPEGALALRRAERLLAIPPALASACLKYISAVLAGNTPLAAHLLIKLTSSRTDLSLESGLLESLSNLEPELKVNLRFPHTAAVLEGNWRALANTGLTRPLFVDAMHRNLIALGYWNAETTGGSAAPEDFLAAAQWPVMGRVLRSRINDLLTREAASEWLIGSGLLFFEGMRQFGRMTEQVRDNDLNVGVDLQSQEGDTRSLARTIRSGVVIGMLVVAFLVSLRAATGPGPLAGLFAAAAALLAAALFWFVARLE